MSAPVINEGTMMVVTRVQPVTMPTMMVGNHAFIKGYPLALGVSHIDQIESSVLPGATEFLCSLQIFSNLFLNSPHRPHRSWLAWSYCCLALSWWFLQLQLQFIVVYLSGEPCWWVRISWPKTIETGFLNCDQGKGYFKIIFRLQFKIDISVQRWQKNSKAYKREFLPLVRSLLGDRCPLPLSAGPAELIERLYSQCPIMNSRSW